MRLLVEFIVSVLSSIGFGVITNIPKRALLPAGITGGVSWCAYWLISLQDHSLVLPNFTATVVIGLLGNYFAIRHRVPVNTIYIPSLVSLVPGGIAYLGARSFTMGKAASAAQQIYNVILIAMALAVGFVVAEVIFLSLIHI